MSLTQSAGKFVEGVTIGFGLTCDWFRKCREILKPITKRSTSKPKYARLTSDTQVKSALFRVFDCKGGPEKELFGY